MTGRLPCCVPFCRRTCTPSGAAGEEWICGTHWRMVPADLRRAYRQARFVVRTRIRHDHPERKIEMSRRFASLMWDRCKESAIAAGGLG